MTKAEVGVGNRGVILNNIDALYRFSQAVAQSALAPKGFEGKPESVMVAIQMGMEVGLTPMSALQNIAVINGRPSIWGDAQLAIVRGSGELEQFEECETNNAIEPAFRELCFEGDEEKRKALKIQIARAQATIDKKADDYGVSCFVKRRGFNEAFGRFTVADANQAALWGKQGPWTQYPSRMLKFRARSFLLRDQFGDALKGLLTREEAQDFIDIDGVATTIPKAEPVPGPVLAPVPSALRKPKEKANPTPAAAETPASTAAAPAAVAPASTALESTASAKTSTPAPDAPQPSNPPTEAAAAKQPESSASTSAKQPVPPSQMPAGWLPFLDPIVPGDVAKSLAEWMETEGISEEELVAWAKGRALVKDGGMKDLNVGKQIGILKAREKVRLAILEGRA